MNENWSGGDSHAYRITLISGQFLKIIAEQKGIDLVARIFEPDGQKLTEVELRTDETIAQFLEPRALGARLLVLAARIQP